MKSTNKGIEPLDDTNRQARKILRKNGAAAVVLLIMHPEGTQIAACARGQMPIEMLLQTVRECLDKIEADAKKKATH